MKTLININKWIEENKLNFKPPICNKMMYDDQLKVFFVGGPNQRKDYHIELGEEFFYQLKGDMYLEVMEFDRKKTIHIPEGHVFLLPSKIPHSPQRMKNTIGMVIERKREINELDGLRYYVDNNNNNNKDDDKNIILYERWFHCQHLGTQLPPIIQTFLQSKEYETGIPSENSQLIQSPYNDDKHKKLIEPINLSEWLYYYWYEIEQIGYKKLFNFYNNNNQYNNETNVLIFGGTHKHNLNDIINNNNMDGFEIFFLQLVNKSTLTIINDKQKQQQNDDKQIYKFNSGDCLCLLYNNQQRIMELETISYSFVLILTMPSS